VAFRYTIDALDSVRSKSEVLGTLIDSVESGNGELPNGWQITWAWQNKEDGQWRKDSFGNTVANSRAGFLLLMARRLRRDFRVAVGRDFVGIPIREATATEEQEIEEISEEFLEERRGRENRKRKARHAKRGRKRKKRKAAKRSKVSKVRKAKPKRKRGRRRR